MSTKRNIIIAGSVILITLWIGLYVLYINKVNRDTNNLSQIPGLTSESEASSTHLLEYTMVPSRYGNFKYPQFINYGDDYKMRKINSDLENEFWFQSAGCGLKSNVTLNVTYSRKDIFQIEENVDNTKCSNGAYKGNYKYTTTFDLRTGEEINFMNLFKFKNFTANEKNILYVVYESQLSKPFIQKSLDEIRVSSTGRSKVTCKDYIDISGIYFSNRYTIASTSDAITVTPYLEIPDGVLSCVDTVVVPIEKLKPLLDDKSILSRLEDESAYKNLYNVKEVTGYDPISLALNDARKRGFISLPDACYISVATGDGVLDEKNTPFTHVEIYNIDPNEGNIDDGISDCSKDSSGHKPKLYTKDTPLDTVVNRGTNQVLINQDPKESSPCFGISYGQCGE